MNPFDVNQLADWETGFEPRITSKLCTPYKEYMGPLEKSAKDKCQYRLLRLPNNMAVISLTVGVGSYANPNDALSLAHLLKHVLLKSQLMSESSQLSGLINSLSNPNHPHSRFSVGNKKTLGNYSPKKLCKRVTEFYNRYYSADIMKLVISGSYSLDELTEMAVNHPLTKNELGKVIHFETLSNINEICLIFPLPYIRAHNRSRLTEYIRWPLNHEGPGSLTQYLRLKGLATYAVAVISSYEGYSLLNLSISVTPKGLKQYDQVVSTIFTYLRMLSESGPQEWI
ncbi:hypothetical protein COEREDRAFT_87811 [Coemansia reversa NRRL 1564]|uniref:Peptidase M16 C-terminal domain-containing protein n=1 Tax=Coemansia reversa (strain ATCC 12441 / NRRL 1564) TaxID=763665 RepID=A0A2G5B8Q0_COERN|nr:hypothetical protein COEREDRAFT_87811 [Coemansia reversa NRRL 1564]|eukprot:PIA15389.1 hypothetical protein COEREDRAFT_87811 [Coemansia reversa NRRL 1564]